jgi:hypothetical protein
LGRARKLRRSAHGAKTSSAAALARHKDTLRRRMHAPQRRAAPPRARGAMTHVRVRDGAHENDNSGRDLPVARLADDGARAPRH